MSPINRRIFLRDLAGGMAAATVLGSSGALAAQVRPSVAITMDDFSFGETPVLTPAERNHKILAALAAHRTRAAAFVVGRSAETDASRAMLASWARAGHIVGNHTYSHRSYTRTSFEEFSADILQAEAFLERVPGYARWFRFPYLKEGDTAEKRDRMRAFLRERGYRNGHVSIDASDWFFDSRLHARLEANPAADLAPYRKVYLDHLWERAVYYDGLAQECVGRSVPHTLLLHFNLINALFLGDVLDMFVAKGWRLVDAKRAYADRFYSSQPDIAPAGESLVWAVAKETGKHSKPLRYPAEDAEYEKPRMDSLGL
jgi:peptidoglycan/xylan/chitin deacetylase (PgdA/CDA1 family)